MLGVDGDEVVGDDVVGVNTRGPCHHVEDGGGILPYREDRLHVHLTVERQVCVDVAVEVDRQVRDAQDRPGGDELLGAVGEHDAPGQAQLPVQPGRQNRPTVDLDGRLLPAGRPREVTERLELQARRVGVGADDAETPGRRVNLRGHVPGDDCPAPDDVVATGAHGICSPWHPLVLADVAGVRQASGDLGGRVVAGRGRGDEVGEPAGEGGG